jgi:hypothetical protein
MWYKLYSGIMILVYPIGIPVMYAYVLWRQRLRLNLTDKKAIKLRSSNASLRKSRFLWEIYKPSLYYWEVIECCRRLLLTGTMVFIFPSQTAQPAIACLLAVAAIVLVLWWTPHAEAMDTRIYVFGAIIVFLSMFLSLLVKIQTGANISFPGSSTYSVTLIVMNILLVLAALTQLVLVGRRAWLSKQSVATLKRGISFKQKTAIDTGAHDHDSDDDNNSDNESKTNNDKRDNNLTTDNIQITTDDDAVYDDDIEASSAPVRRASTIHLLERRI